MNIDAFNVVPESSFFFFILFSLFFSKAVISTILSLSSLIYSSVSFILLLIPSTVFFLLVIILLISACLNIFLICALHSFLKILDYLYYHSSEFFQVSCLSLLYLVVLLGFYFIPSSETYSSAVSFYLTCCVCSLTGCRIMAPLASCVCPHLVMASSLSLEVEDLFFVDSTSFLSMVVQQLVVILMSP